MNHRNRALHGFTLVELLVVIAIIAILAALIFPTFSRAREQTRQTQCMQQMHDIYVALSVYAQDNNKYPATLYGYAESATGFYVGTNGTPLAYNSSQLAYRPLFQGQKPLNNPNAFICPDKPSVDPNTVMPVAYPTLPQIKLAGPVGFTPTIQQAIGAVNVGGQALTVPVGLGAYFYAFDGYDVGPGIMTDSNGNVVSNGQNELHYSIDWTGGSGPDDVPNQLKYIKTASPDHTVITWCNYHVVVNHSDTVPVMFMNGTMKPINAKEFIQKGPLGF